MFKAEVASLVSKDSVPRVHYRESPEEVLKTIGAHCCLCDHSTSTLVGNGLDFEYSCCNDRFTAFVCDNCGLIFLNPRPHISEFQRIYPDNYHAFEFSKEQYGLVYNVRRRLEARRLLSWCGDLSASAKILDLGCGDGFHLDLLREFGPSSWSIHGVDIDERAVDICREKGLDVFQGALGESNYLHNSFDFVFTVQTIEHVEDPVQLVRNISKYLKPGGKLVIVTDNTDSPDFSLFKRSYWGGYHFPRHWNLFNRTNILKVAELADLRSDLVTTQVSPVNWTYSIRNMLFDYGAPRWIVDRFSLRSTFTLTVFTAFDMIFDLFGNGALLRAHFSKPEEKQK